MYNGLLHLHNFLRWIVLLLLVVALVKSFMDQNKPFTPGHRKTGLFLMISCDVMLLLGIYQWVTGPLGLNSIKLNGMALVMKDAVLRFYAVEHTIGMLIGIVLVHIGYSHAKRNLPDDLKHKRTLLYYGLALLVILISVPWPFREIGVGRPWFPGM